MPHPTAMPHPTPARRPRRPRRRRGAVVALALTLVLGGLLPAAPARAQDVRSGLASVAGLDPDLDPRELELAEAMLGLDAEQRAALDDLAEDWQRWYAEASAAHRAAMVALRPEGGTASPGYQALQARYAERFRAITDQARADAAAAATEAEADAIRAAAREALDALRSELTERLAEFGPESEGRAAAMAVLEDRRRAADAWYLTRLERRDALLESIRGLLREPQLETWPEFRRTIRRGTLSAARLGGEGLDLEVLLAGLTPDGAVRATARVALREWALAVDAALERRNRQLRDPALAGDDDDRRRAATRDAIARRVEVRDVNLRGLDALVARVATVDASLAERLRDAGMTRAFAVALRPTAADRVLDAAFALDLDGVLPPEDARAMADLRSRHAAETREHRRQLVQLAVAVEPTLLRRRLVPEEAGGRAERDRDPIDLARRAWAQRLEARVAVVRSLLGADRFEALPGAARFRSG